MIKLIGLCYKGAMRWSARTLLLLLPILTALAGCGDGGGGGPTIASQTVSLSVAPGDGKNTLTFSAPSGSATTSFNIYWSTSPEVTPSTGMKIENVSPFIHSPLTNGTVIFYIVAPVSGGIEGTPSAEVGAMPGKWTALNPSGTPPPPPGRDSHTAVYNSTSDRMIVFGGKTQSATFSDLWVLTGAKEANPAWSSQSATGPTARAGHTAIYNETINKMVVFGGSFDPNGDGLTNELWALSNTDAEGASPEWAQTAIPGSPPARWGHAAVYDSEEDLMILFGGTSQTGGGLQNDVWVLSKATKNPAWQKIEPTGTLPLRRCCFAFSYDPAGKRLIIFGGFGGGANARPTPLADLWTLSFDSTFQNGAWKNLDPSGGGAPTARCCAVSLFTGDKLLLFGGGSFQAASDDKIHALTLQSSTFVSADGPSGGPSPRNFPTAVSAGFFLLFGGSGSSGPLNDLWRLE